MPVSRLLILFAVVGPTVLSCLPTLDTTPAEVVDEIHAHLQPGAPREAVEWYLAQAGFHYSFDRFANRYQAIIRHPDSSFHAISIYIYLSPEGFFERAEARDSYTFP